MRSLLAAILELGVEEILVIGHTDCGVQGMNGREMIEKLKERGISGEHIDLIRHSGVPLEEWLGGFPCVEISVREAVECLRKHPLMPKDIKIYGFVMDSVTGELRAVPETE